MGANEKDRFDDLLEGALRRYSEVEPRTGLEGRVLARLATQSNRMRTNWIWACASVVAAAAIAVSIWSGVNRHRSFPGERTDKRAAVQHVEALLSPRNMIREPNAVKTRTKTSRQRAHVTHKPEPRFPQFPSNNVLNQQELAVAQYVKRFPEQAMLISKEQQAFEDETRKAEKDAGIVSPLSEVER